MRRNFAGDSGAALLGATAQPARSDLSTDCGHDRGRRSEFAAAGRRRPEQQIQWRQAERAGDVTHARGVAGAGRRIAPPWGTFPPKYRKRGEFTCI